MRKLSEQELKLVQLAIISKDLTVMEVIAEIYDHYITHLEGFSEEEFKSELVKLESIWIYPYCRDLQGQFSDSVNKSIRSLQWKITKSYFTWPRLMVTLVLFLTAYLSSIFIPSKIFFLGIIAPILIFLLVFGLLMTYRSKRKFNYLKQIFNFRTTGSLLISGESSYMFSHAIFPIQLLNLFILAPKNLGIIDDFSSPWMTFIFLFFSFFLFLHTLTIHEAWKIKSKTALL
jgi:hypothetical protein